VGVGHEEEYISGPSQSGKGDPEKYVTILRYRVRKNERRFRKMEFVSDSLHFLS
jgi:hypothetical protein